MIVLSPIFTAVSPAEMAKLLESIDNALTSLEEKISDLHNTLGSIIAEATPGSTPATGQSIVRIYQQTIPSKTLTTSTLPPPSTSSMGTQSIGTQTDL